MGPDFKKLRIASSVMCGVFCLLLIVLWDRSYWWYDNAHCPLRSPRMLIMNSFGGRLSFYAGKRIDYRSGWFPSGWGTDSTPVRNIAPSSLKRPKSYWGYNNDHYGCFILFPHWFPALVMGALMAGFGIRPPYRFSLRTLLIVMTLFALLLGLIVYASR